MCAQPYLTWPEHAAVPEPDEPRPPDRPPDVFRGGEPLRALLDAARLVPDVTAGAVLLRAGDCWAIPGLPTHPLLGSRSPVVAAVHRQVGAPGISSSFLWPAGDPDAPRSHLRVTALNAPPTGAPPATVLLLSPAGELHGLTPRELQVLGLLVEGVGNQQIADTLAIAPRTVACHLEHILVKLGTPTWTLAAVRAERRGLYVPAGGSLRR